MISVVLATRGGERFKRFVSCVGRTISQPDAVQLVACYDDMDGIERDYPKHEREYPDFDLDFLCGHTPFRASQALEGCMCAACGEIIVHLNDDVEIETQRWDRIIEDTFQEHGPFCAPWADNVRTQKLNVFPILSRRAWDIIHVQDFDYWRYRIDTHIWDVYQKLAALGHDLIVKIPVVFRHLRGKEADERTAWKHDAALYRTLDEERMMNARKIAWLKSAAPSFSGPNLDRV